MFPFDNENKTILLKMWLIVANGTRGSAVASGYSLQDGRSPVPFPTGFLYFFIDIILPAAL
jgi:hypothetical protein